MMLPVLLTCVLAGCGSNQSTAKYTKQDVQNLVLKAYDYVKANGKDKALKEFMNPKGPFMKGELYIYADDFNGTVLSHGGDPTLVGKNLIADKDPNGVMAVQAASNLAKTKGSGWMTCMFPNPITKKQQKKLIFVKKVDNNWFLGSGQYL
jgi:signal transduction histidine kinase